MPYGLKDIELAKLNEVFAANERIECVVLYGSRAKGNYKPFSDVDITLEGAGLTLTDLSRLSLAIDDLLLPYLFDISIFHTLKNEALIDHIHRMGITIYEKKSEWKEYKLGEVIKTNVESIGKDYPYSKILYLDTGSITQNNIDLYQEFELNKAPSRAKRLVKQDDIIYSSVRPNQLHYGYITNPANNLVVSTGFVTITCNKAYIEPKFLYYYLTQENITEYLHSVAEASTSAYPSLKPSDIEYLDISLPPLSEQKRIANILSSLDDKIDLLHRENKTLEAMAETLFRQWFIEEAKEDWKEGKLGDILSVKGGTTPSTKEPHFWNGDIAWTSPRDVTTLNGLYLFETEKKITQKGLEQISSGLLPTGTLLMSSRAPVGVLAFAEIPLAINQGYIAIIDDKGYSKEFIYFWLKTNIDLVHSYSNGSTFMEISKSAFKSLDILIPTKGEVECFVSDVKPYFDKIRINEIQIQNLIQQRDSLLPRLMSGEINIL